MLLWVLLGLPAMAAAGGGAETHASRSAGHRWDRGPYRAEVVPARGGAYWRVWYRYDDDAHSLAEGLELDEEKARRSANRWLTDNATDAPMVRHGLRMDGDCEAIAVVQLQEWIDWAAPRLELSANDGADPDALLRTLLVETFPDCAVGEPEIRGRPWGVAAEQFGRMLEQAQRGDLLDVAPPAEVLAARAVGMSVPKRTGTAFWHGELRRWVVVVDEHPSGRGYRWQVWDGVRVGTPAATGAAPTIDVAADAARRWIDRQEGMR